MRRAASGDGRARLTAPVPLPYGSQTACRDGRHDVMKGPVLTGGVT
jgi:hypothetical protein